MKKYRTNYKVATMWLDNSYILCNNITEIDNTVYDNIRFSLADDDDCTIEIFQWYLTDCSEPEVEYLEETFGLKFTYSELLEVFVLCVDHYGTAWDYVYCETTNENAARNLGEWK